MAYNPNVPNGQATMANSEPVVIASDQLAISNKPKGLTIVGAAASIAALNTDLLTGTVSGWYDASLFQSVSVQIIGSAGITAGAIFFEQTNDTTAAASGNIWPMEELTTLTPTPQIAAITIAASTTRLFSGAITARYVRVRVSTAFATANVQAVAAFSQLPYNRMVQTVHQATAANHLVTATLAAGTSAVGDVGVQYRANATGAATVASVLSQATTATTSVKATAGRLIGFDLVNTSAALRSVKIFNVAAPTMGTTAAAFEIDIPAGARVTAQYPGGLAFSTAIVYAVTSAKGLTDNTATGLAASDVSGHIAFA